MELLKLDPTTYLPVDYLDGHSSLIWTERFSELGEFELRTPLIEEYMEKLPEDTLVSHRETQEVFNVDTLNIETTDEGERELVIKGLSFEAILKDRMAYGSPHRQPWLLPRQYTAPQACALLAYNYLCNPYGKDLTKSAMYGMTPYNQVPNLGVGLRVSSFLPWTGDWWLESGEVYSQFTDWLARKNLGVRNVRPVDPLETQQVDMTYSSIDSNGVFGLEGSGGKLRIMIYTGFDRQEGQADYTGTPISFKYDEGDLNDPKYLFSTRDLKNVCTVGSSTGSVDVYADDNVSPYLTGRARRHLYLDGGDQGDIEHVAFITALVQKGEIELAKHNRKQLFDAEISESTPFKYKKDYDLGDRVTLYGEYGFRPTMRVNEYVRIDDDEGDRGYPTLILA